MIVVAYILAATGLTACAAILRNEQLNRRKHRRWISVHKAALARQAEDFAWQFHRLDAVRLAMLITCKRYEVRLAGFVADRLAVHLELADSFEREIARAQEQVELALAPDLRVVQ